VAACGDVAFVLRFLSIQVIKGGCVTGPLTCEAFKSAEAYRKFDPFGQEREDMGTDCLPFNGTAISEDFVASPNCELPCDSPGFWAILQGHSLMVADGEGEPTLPFGDLPQHFAVEHGPVCIGFWQGNPLRAFSIGARNEILLPYVAMPFRGAETRLNEPLLTLAGLAHQILNWERMSAFCSRCGSDMERISGTWGKRCLSCRHEHFPSIHPCVIVLVRRDDELLLVRKAEWPDGRYSLVAGFVEFGESLEECVRREVREETGVEVANVRYVGSQSWPFPSQQMIGFVADYVGGDIKVDEAELEDARWFKDDALPLSAGNHSISNWIMKTYGRAE
jgi:NAD+ diphosphatase